MSVFFAAVALASLDKPNEFYVNQRAPLTPSPFQKLPIGAIRPEGWLRKQLTLQAEGFSGQLARLSPWLDPKENAWRDPNRTGRNGWEELPYWLKGQLDLGYVLDDPKIIKEAEEWVNAILAGQREDGWFGPVSNLTSVNGKPDLWPNMIALFVLQSFYERTNDPRVLPFMARYFGWLEKLPDNQFLVPESYWSYHRGGDNLISVLWLYNRTGEPKLLDLARKIHRLTADWTTKVPNRHGVNFAQAFREPTTFGLLDPEPKFTFGARRNHDEFYAQYGQVPGGMYGADENARPGLGDPRQAAETCAMVEMMLSYEHLALVTGDVRWADDAENVAFNSLPAAMTDDLKALRYLTSVNMVQSDKTDKNPGIENSGPMFHYDPRDHRCCQHNVSHGWPYYAEHLWLATNNNGLLALLYAPSTVTAKVGSGSTVTIRETTDYPFRETVRMEFSLPRPERFPLSLRVPAWAREAKISVNGENVPSGDAGQLVTLDRTWQNGDRVELRLPMEVKVRQWPAQKGAVSIDRGPLSYSLRIRERYERTGGTDEFPSFNVFADSPWNYGLPENPELTVIERPMPADDQPFRADAAPIEIRTKGRRIPNWQTDTRGLVGKLQPSPAHTREPLEELTLIPMGAARLRVAMFPTVTTSRGAAWTPPQRPIKAPLKATASHVFDSLDALTDGLVPESSSDMEVPRFTWWDHVGTEEWVEVDLGRARKVSKTEVYWYDDERTGGRCRPPASWRLEYQNAKGQWVPVQTKGTYGVAIDRFNAVGFTPVTARKLRIVAQLRPGVSSGILEWRVR